jgi:hypothetical protein
MHPIINNAIKISEKKKHTQLTNNVFHPNPKDEKNNTRSNNTMNLEKKN